MIVTSETTALVAMTIAARTGSPPVLRNTGSGDAGPPALRITRPITSNIRTGTARAPNRPSGSRTKILISSQTSCHKPFMSIPDRVARQAEEHVLERRLGGVRVGHHDAVARHALDHVGHEARVAAADGHR